MTVAVLVLVRVFILVTMPMVMLVLCLLLFHRLLQSVHGTSGFSIFMVCVTVAVCMIMKEHQSYHINQQAED